MTAFGGASRGPLARLLQEPRIAVAEIDPREVAPDMGLYPEEAAPLGRAVLTRRQQFTAGRVLARKAWRELGHAPAPLLNDEQRVPIWPSGLVGTITHTTTWCAVAVARASEIRSLGADVEPSTPLEVALWPRVCRPEERRWLDAQPEPPRGLLAKALFSAKESIYKALYPSVRVFLDFQGMSIALEPEPDETWSWHATLQTAWGPLVAGERFVGGRLSLGPELIVSAIVL